MGTEEKNDHDSYHRYMANTVTWRLVYFTQSSDIDNRDATEIPHTYVDSGDQYGLDSKVADLSASHSLCGLVHSMV